MHLDDPLELHLRVTPKQKSALAVAGLRTVRDILWRFPARYDSFSEPRKISSLIAAERALVVGRVLGTKVQKGFRKNIIIAETRVADNSGEIRVLWFNQPHMATVLVPGATYAFSGKIGTGKRGIFMTRPVWRPAADLSDGNADALTPAYPESRGVPSRWLRGAVRTLLEKFNASPAQDPIPLEILRRYNLPRLQTALRAIHEPSDEKIALAARKRFAFEEIFLIQLNRQKIRTLRERSRAVPIRAPQELLAAFHRALPFALTNAQKHAARAILADIARSVPMARLLEGDVGSGKTAVAAIAAFAAAADGHQVAYMAPTEILARQHYAEFCERLKLHRIPVGLITSSECRKFPSKAFPNQDTHASRAQFLKWAASGEIPVIIGTHALVQDSMRFRRLALSIIDEQHRFGIAQRAELASATEHGTPHLLSMTATPIPRTLALTLYGDLELTLLDEMPPGRKPIITVIVPPTERQGAYEKMREELNRGRQAYVVCPRIEETTDAKISLEMKSVKAEAKKLAEKVFPEFRVDMLHGKLLPREKEKIMGDFRDGKINILVATSVIEVGVNVPNATMILIEGADRFGLAQLHQLRGRVLRGTHQPHCFVFSESSSAKTLERLRALRTAKNGFELAEYDLKFRGAGELSGAQQWGISDTGMEALKNLKMVEAARAEARALLDRDEELCAFPLLSTAARRFAHLHLE